MNNMVDSIKQLRNEIQILKENNIDIGKLTTIADSIEREVEENYVELPRDADGFTIAPLNDMVNSNGTQFIVSSIEMLANGMWLLHGDFHENGRLSNEFATMCRHRKSPTVEDVLKVFADRVYNESMKFNQVSDDTIAEYAAKLQLKEEK